MTNKLRHLRSNVPENVPLNTQMDLGQFAINTADGKVFIKRSDEVVKDITDNIFRNDSSIVITDTPLSNVGVISITVDNEEKIRINQPEIRLKTDTIIENEFELRFSESTVNGTDYVALKAPTEMDPAGSYTLSLPTATGTIGQIIGTDGTGQLNFYDADIFAGNRIYVSEAKGDDANDGITAPVRTIKRALQIVSGFVYDGGGVPNGQRWNVEVAAGNYYEDNPIIVPDNVSVIGDGLRACVLRPLNPNLDFLRVRNGCYFTEFTFRDALTGAPGAPDPTGSPLYTWDYAVAFDDPTDVTTDRTGYTNLPVTLPLITTSPYIQNCSLISFLGGNGVLVDGSKIVTPNSPLDALLVENPVDLSNGQPDQGKSMVANAFTMLSFGGTGWRVINDAYVQIVSCFQIFMLNGTYTQNGGYCSVTNSATNFGLYALRSSGYSPNAFQFDRGFIGGTGTNDNKQTINAFGFERPNGPVEEFIVRIYDETTEEDLTDSTYKAPSGGFAEATFDAAVDVIPGDPAVFNIVGHGFNNQDQVIYSIEGGTTIGGMFDSDSYYVDFISANSFRLSYDETFTKLLSVSAAGTGTQTFRRNIYEMIVNDVLETHNTFQTLILDPTAETFAVGDVITGNDTSPPGNPHNAYVYSWEPVARELVVSINNVTVGVTQQRVPFNDTSEITTINGVVLGTPASITTTTFRSDLWASTFEVIPTVLGGQFNGLPTLPGREIRFHRPSITNSSAHTWEYAGSGTDYNALPQNGGKTREEYEQFSELAGKVYTSGTNELGDFKVGNFIRAFNRTGNVVFTNNVSIDTLDVLRLALSDVEITGISIDPDLGENEVGGPSNSRLSTQLATWSYANNRLGAFIDKDVSTNAVPGNVVQLNANGQINRDLIPSQRSFNSFVTQGFRSRLTIADDIPSNDSQSGDIVSENFEQVALNIDNPVTVEEGWTITQPASGAQGFIKADATSATTIVVASEFGTFETPDFDTVNSLVINGDATPGDGDLVVIPTVVGPTLPTSQNYIITRSVSSQYLITANSTVLDYTNVSVTSAVKYNNTIYVETTTPHNLNVTQRIQLDLTDDEFDVVDYIDTIISTTEYSVPDPGNDSPLFTTTATSSITGTTGTSTTGSSPLSSLSGNTINNGDFVFGVDLPEGSKVSNVSGVDPVTFDITFPATATVSGTSTAALTFVSQIARTGTTKTVITAADSLASGAFDRADEGVLINVDNLSFNEGTGYTPAVGSTTYLRVPLTGGTGTGAQANVTVANGSVIDVDLIRGGTGYTLGDTISANNANIGGTGAGFDIQVTAVEQRIYVDIVGGALFVAEAGSIDFIEDNVSVQQTITATDTTNITFDALPVGSGGDVDYTTSRITLVGHSFTDGDPVQYDPAPNVAIGSLITLNVYYVRVIDASTIELYNDYALTTQRTFGTSSSGTHSLTSFAVNTVDNSLFVPAHGFITGDAVRMVGNDLPSFFQGSTIQIPSNTYFFIGSVTTNTFTLHELRSDALASSGGITQVPYNITVTGTGDITLIDNAITVVDVINTSSQLLDNWSVLVADNIDASNIVSGIVSTSRLGLGSATDSTFLRGDSSWTTAVQTFEYVDGTPDATILSDSLINFTASINGTYETNDVSGFVDIDVQRVNEQASQTYSTLGASSFLKQHFVVGSGARTIEATPQPITGLTDGMVYVRTFAEGGTIDAATLQNQTLTYVLDSINHTDQPVNKGGTNVTTYAAGDMLYSATLNPSALTKLSIGSANTFLTSNGSTGPQWSNNLVVDGGNITTGAATFNLLPDAGITTVNAFEEAENVNIAVNPATGNIIIGSLTSTTRVGTLSVQDTSFISTSSTAAIAGATLVSSFPIVTFRSGKYNFQLTCTAGPDAGTFQTSELLIIHDGTTATLVEYAVLKTGANELGIFTTAVNGANVEITFTPTAGDTINLILSRTLTIV